MPPCDQPSAWEGRLSRMTLRGNAKDAHMAMLAACSASANLFFICQECITEDEYDTLLEQANIDHAAPNAGLSGSWEAIVVRIGHARGPRGSEYGSNYYIQSLTHLSSEPIDSSSFCDDAPYWRAASESIADAQAVAQSALAPAGPRAKPKSL